jgi:hypothetical protein
LAQEVAWVRSRAALRAKEWPLGGDTRAALVHGGCHGGKDC